MKAEKEKLTSPRLKMLEKDLLKIKKAVAYLEKEKGKLVEEKMVARIKIRKEKEILRLKRKIKGLK